MLFKIEFDGEHKLTRADVVALRLRITSCDVNIHDLVHFSVGDIQPFQLKVDFFLDPRVLIRDIVKRVFISVSLGRSHAVVPIETKRMILRRVDVGRKIVIPAGVFLRVRAGNIPVVVPVHTDVIIYTQPAEIGVVKFSSPGLKIIFTFDKIPVKETKRVGICVGKAC